MFIKKAWVSRENLPTRPDIKTDAFDLFLPIYLKDIFFSQVVLTFEDSLASSSILSTRFFFVWAIGSLTSSRILSLFQGKLTSTNSALSFKSESELSLYSITQVDCLGFCLITSALTKI